MHFEAKMAQLSARRAQGLDFPLSRAEPQLVKKLLDRLGALELTFCGLRPDTQHTAPDTTHRRTSSDSFRSVSLSSALIPFSFFFFSFFYFLPCSFSFFSYSSSSSCLFWLCTLGPSTRAYISSRREPLSSSFLMDHRYPLSPASNLPSSF